MRTVAILLLFAVAGAGTPALADSMTGSVAEGQELALGTCAKCHVVAEKQAMPKPPVRNVPSFFELAEDPSKTDFYLRSYFRTSHQNMPNFMLTPEETDNIIAYIFSLKEK